MLSCARKPAIWCIATDKAGNLSEPAAFTVTVATVRNTVAPMIVPPAAIMVGTKNGATYVGAIGAATASDNVSSGTGLAITSNAPAAFPLGMTLVTWTATDTAGNSSSASQLVTVVDDAPPTIVAPAAASPSSLWPANGKLVPVAVSGIVTDNGSGIGSATYRVVDSYGEVQPAGAVTVGADGRYAFTLMLPARRSGNDKDGRRFAVTVDVTDRAGNTSATSAVVVVPHDMGGK